MKINGHDITAEPAAVPVGEVPKLERLLTPEEAAELLRVPVSWMYQHTRRRSGPTTGPAKGNAVDSSDG